MPHLAHEHGEGFIRPETVGTEVESTPGPPAWLSILVVIAVAIVCVLVAQAAIAVDWPLADWRPRIWHPVAEWTPRIWNPSGFHEWR